MNTCGFCGGIIRKCDECSKSFENTVHVYHVDDRVNHRHFCSRECADKNVPKIILALVGFR